MRDLLRIAAAGNRFALIDGFRDGPPADPDQLARRLAARYAVDGLLLLLPPRASGDVRMVLYNADGSRPEACGNGLRAIAKIAVDRGYATGAQLIVESDAGPRAVEALYSGERVVAARAELGTPRIDALEQTLSVKSEVIRVSVVELGNPHCVVFVEDIERARMDMLGPLLESHPRFPNRTNVEFAQALRSGLRVRIWERGVGETLSCGTGAAAAAITAIALGRSRSPVAVETRGGELVVSWNAGAAVLEGPVDEPEPLELLAVE